MIRKTEAMVALVPDVDHTDYEGYFVKLSSGNPTLVTAATDDVFGVITDGETTEGHDSIAVSRGYSGIVDVKVNATSAAISAGDILELTADGTVQAPSGTTGNIQVAQAMEDGKSEELIMAILIPPVTIA